MKQEKRLEVIQRVFRGELTVVETAMIVGVSERQCYSISADLESDLGLCSSFNMLLSCVLSWSVGVFSLRGVFDVDVCNP